MTVGAIVVWPVPTSGNQKHQQEHLASGASVLPGQNMCDGRTCARGHDCRCLVPKASRSLGSVPTQFHPLTPPDCSVSWEPCSMRMRSEGHSHM